jgi:hypothetical protein
MAFMALSWLNVCSCEGKQCGDDGCGGSCGACGPDQTCNNNQCVPTSGCDHAGFDPNGGQTAIYDGGSQLFLYQADSTSGTPVDALVFEIYQADGGPSAPGTYPILDENYSVSNLNVLVYYDCDGGMNCSKTFLANSGTMHITYIGDVGNHFYGTLSNVTLVEVTIDPFTYDSTPVAEGQTWCIYDYTFDTNIN